MGEEINAMIDNIVTCRQPHFVLVHGICGGAWCWYKVRCLMESSGYKVSCLDLKSAGVDRSDPNAVLAFHDYNKPLIDLLLALPDDEKVILVGHSAGGLSVTEATHKFAKKIRLAVYIAATMLRTGFCTDQDVKDYISACIFKEFALKKKKKRRILSIESLMEKGYGVAVGIMHIRRHFLCKILNGRPNAMVSICHHTIAAGLVHKALHHLNY